MVYWSLQQITSYTTVAIFLALFSKRGEPKSSRRVIEPADAKLRPVHALWDHNTKIGIFLFILVTGEYVSNIAIGVTSLAKVDHYDQGCLFSVHWPKEIVLLGYVLSFVRCRY
jgi:hypothetical protein